MGEACDSGAKLDQGLVLLLGDFGDAVEAGAVDVPEREIVEHVAEGPDPQLLVEHLGPLFADPVDELYVIVENIPHNAKVTIRPRINNLRRRIFDA